MKKEAGKGVSGPAARAWKEALRNEVEGREFHRMAAANARLDGARQMFTFLMGEEERHREAILDRIERMERGKPLRPVRRGPGKGRIRKFRTPLFPATSLSGGSGRRGRPPRCRSG